MIDTRDMSMSIVFFDFNPEIFVDKRIFLCYNEKVKRGRHPSEKTDFIACTYEKGETPMEKNVTVVDEQGNVYEATYPKRAKGLVKNGRARFIDDNTICLTSPPDISNTEDSTMSENKNTQNVEEIVNQTAAKEAQYSVEYVLAQIEAINKQSEALHAKLTGLMQVCSDNSKNSYAYNNAKLLLDAIRCRETTNQQMLRIYETLLNKLTLPAESQAELDKWKALSKLADMGNSKEGASMLESIVSIMDNA